MGILLTLLGLVALTFLGFALFAMGFLTAIIFVGILTLVTLAWVQWQARHNRGFAFDDSIIPTEEQYERALRTIVESTGKDPAADRQNSASESEDAGEEQLS